MLLNAAHLSDPTIAAKSAAKKKAKKLDAAEIYATTNTIHTPLAPSNFTLKA